MRQSAVTTRLTGLRSGFLRVFLVIASIVANGALFYVLALARTGPSTPAVQDHAQMRVISLDLPTTAEVEQDVPDPAADTIRRTQDDTLAVSFEPLVDVSQSFMPRLDDWMNDISPDLPGMSVVLPALSDVKSVESSPVSGIGESLSILKVDRAPSRISAVPPAYPQWARRAGLEAVVTLRFVVAADGTVTDVKVHKIEGDERFTTEAIRAVSAWRFDSAVKDGKAVACWCFQKVNFKLMR